MKICFFMYTPFVYGGIERVVSNLSNTLTKNGYDVTILCKDNNKIDRSIYNLDEKVKIEYCELETTKDKIACFSDRALSYINKKTNILKNNINILEKAYIHKNEFLRKSAIKIINKNKYDVVIGVNGYFSLILASIKESINCKCIGWQHSTYEAYFNTKNKYYYNQSLLYKKYIPKLDEYVVLTKILKTEVDKEFGISSKNIYNINSFKSEEISDLTNKEFLAVGRLTSAKGYDNLIKIFAIFCKKNKDWNLKIVGNGEEKESLNKLIKNYKLENRIEIIPFTANIKSYYLNSSALLITSRWEGFGMTAIEAMEFGLPIIAYDIPSMVEITENGKYGKLIQNNNMNQFAEQLEEFSKSLEKRREYSKLSKERSKDFYEEKIINKWNEILKK